MIKSVVEIVMPSLEFMNHKYRKRDVPPRLRISPIGLEFVNGSFTYRKLTFTCGLTNIFSFIHAPRVWPGLELGRSF